MSNFENTFSNKNNEYFSLSTWLIPIVLSIVLVVMSFINFLLFHILAELFAIIIAVLTCVVAWNMYPFTRNNYLMYLGSGYFWIGLLDLLHAMSYKGMNVIPDGGANMGVQFWIGTRYLEAVLLLSAPWFLTHSFNRYRYFILYGLAALILTFFVLAGIFPDSFLDGEGLTKFKIYSEYTIIFILALAIYYLNRQQDFLEERIVKVLIVSIVFTMLAELAFTFYVDVYGLSNIIGHVFKIFSFWLIFQAIIRTTLREPFLIMSKGASTYDAIPDAAIVVDENGIIRQANNAACKLANLKGKELIGKNNHAIFHPMNTKIESCLICQAIVNNNEVHGLEIECDKKNTWFDFSLSHIKGASSLNGTVEVIRDITQRKQYENSLRELDSLKNSIVENLPNMLFVKDAKDHRYLEWNKAAEELTGLLKEDVLGKTDFDIWPRKEAQFFTDKDNEVIQSKELFDIAEEPITTKEKGPRTLHTKKIPITDEQGNVKYLLGISDDITEKLRTENVLARSQKMQVVGQMSGGIAHDFNNQLGVILGYADLLSEQDLPENQLKWIKAVQEAANRCAELTKQLLIFSRNGEIDKSTVDVNKLILEIEVMIQRSLTPEINIEYSLAENLWQTEINAGGYKDVLLNLILNARDAMPDGGLLKIETSNSILDAKSAALLPNISEGNYVQIMVSDTGQGMSEEICEHVFEPFFTTKDVGKGTGLGLSMVYGFVHRYGGDISLDTKLGEGSTFKIYLPSIDKIGIEKNAFLEAKASEKGSESILIVDDEAALLGYAQELLKKWGYQIFTASNAVDAINILESTSIDLLFTDVVMPGGMSGYQLAEKALQMNVKLRVLITSGYADKIDGNEEFAKYEFQHLAKPYSRSTLLEKLRYLLDA